ncbi:hypothetical protein Taro_054264 [Colocasia esculenta]|uniref:Uncharacterized protein n=1 Tax=Colocasia esculenta TaxID=4460 RepID=A0A843XND9_COLES|nr:hypothetical protein [Colocasia esculenta]
MTRQSGVSPSCRGEAGRRNYAAMALRLHEEAGGGPVSSLCAGARLWLLRQADSRSKEATWASAEGGREGAVRWPWRDEGWAARSTQEVQLGQGAARKSRPGQGSGLVLCAGGAAKSWKAAKSGARPCDEGGWPGMMARWCSGACGQLRWRSRPAEVPILVRCEGGIQEAGRSCAMEPGCL